ncbi:MAG: hypothetical protein GTO14_00350 [Anaerolineales bacterium]|nr:hypothetical protein [Anaerolineales bacterium]
MSEFQVGMKIYDGDWFLKYNLSYEKAAQCLQEWGVTYVLAQNRFLPMPDSAIDSEVAPDLVERYRSFKDRDFRDALGMAGIEYWLAVCMFFDPRALEVDPSLVPVGSDGRLMPKIDWYIGISPSRDDFVCLKTTAIAEAVRALEPDGVFLSFTRWPGFWELWMPHLSRYDFPEYSYDPHTLDRFVQETGVHLPSQEPLNAAAWIETHAREVWTNWKCQVVKNVIRQVRSASRAEKSDVRIMLNTLPLGFDFDVAQEKVFGQSVELLADGVDIFEVMTYHQILKRPIRWIPKIGEQVKRRTGKETVCALQARPLYLDGIHSKEKRSSTISAEEFAEAIDAIEASNLDGIVIFVWSDLLEKALMEKDERRVDAIRTAVGRRNARSNGEQ